MWVPPMVKRAQVDIQDTKSESENLQSRNADWYSFKLCVHKLTEHMHLGNISTRKQIILQNSKSPIILPLYRKDTHKSISI